MCSASCTSSSRDLTTKISLDVSCDTDDVLTVLDAFSAERDSEKPSADPETRAVGASAYANTCLGRCASLRSSKCARSTLRLCTALSLGRNSPQSLSRRSRSSPCSPFFGGVSQAHGRVKGRLVPITPSTKVIPRLAQRPLFPAHPRPTATSLWIAPTRRVYHTRTT